MSIGIFTEKDHPPALTEIMEKLGKQKKYWNELTIFLEQLGNCKSEFKFYGKNYGWSLRYKKSGKAVASLYPGKDEIIVQIILNKAALKYAKGIDLDQEIMNAINRSPMYLEGKWLFIKIKSLKILNDIKTLIYLKLKIKKED